MCNDALLTWSVFQLGQSYLRLLHEKKIWKWKEQGVEESVLVGLRSFCSNSVSASPPALKKDPQACKQNGSEDMHSWSPVILWFHYFVFPWCFSPYLRPVVKMIRVSHEVKGGGDPLSTKHRACWSFLLICTNFIRELWHCISQIFRISH